MKISFRLWSKPSIKPLKNPNLSPSSKVFITDFDRSKPIPDPNAKKPKIIPPISNEWTEGVVKFETTNSLLVVDPNVTYGLNLRNSTTKTKRDGNWFRTINRRFEGSSKVVPVSDQLKNDLERLPDHTGMVEFEDMPVEDFAAALLRGYGWKGIEDPSWINKKDHPFNKVFSFRNRKGLGFVEHEAKMDAAKEEEVMVSRSKRSREEEESWLTSHIRVRVISKELKGGSLFLKKGHVVDVVRPKRRRITCDLAIDDTREIIQGVQPEFLETVLPKLGGPVLVLYGRYKGVFGTLLYKDTQRQTAFVLHAATHTVFHVKFDHIAEYVVDDVGY